VNNLQDYSLTTTKLTGHSGNNTEIHIQEYSCHFVQYFSNREVNTQDTTKLDQHMSDLKHILHNSESCEQHSTQGIHLMKGDFLIFPYVSSGN